MSDKDVELADLSIPKEKFLTWLTNKREILLPDINDADDNLRGTIMEVLGLLQGELSSYYTSNNNPNSQYYWPNIKPEIVNKFRLLYIYLIGELDKETPTKTQSELIAWKSGTKKYIEEALNIAIKTQKGGKKRKQTRRKQTRRKQTRRKQTRRSK